VAGTGDRCGFRLSFGCYSSSGSYISQSDLRVHFGLGQFTAAKLQIVWPSGTVERLSVEANLVITVVEGRA
jgi:hypothetical protein